MSHTLFIIKNADFSSHPVGKVAVDTDSPTIPVIPPIDKPSDTTIPVTGIAISGSNAVNATSANYTVSYTPSDTTQRGVTWSITAGSDYASIDASGKLTVLQGASSNSVTINATSKYNSSVTAPKTVTVTYPQQTPTVTGITISYEKQSDTQYQFSATCTPAGSPQGVTWSITSGTSYATISSTGLLTVQPGASSSSVTVQAQSASNTSIKQTQTITVTYPQQTVAVSSITINAPSKTADNTYQFSATVSPDNASNKSLTWSIDSGSQYASITADGVLTVLPGASSSVVRVKATSVSNTNVAKTYDITVTYEQQGGGEIDTEQYENPAWAIGYYGASSDVNTPTSGPNSSYAAKNGFLFIPPANVLTASEYDSIFVKAGYKIRLIAFNGSSWRRIDGEGKGEFTGPVTITNIADKVSYILSGATKFAMNLSDVNSVWWTNVVDISSHKDTVTEEGIVLIKKKQSTPVFPDTPGEGDGEEEQPPVTDPTTWDEIVAQYPAIVDVVGDNNKLKNVVTQYPSAVHSLVDTGKKPSLLMSGVSSAYDAVFDLMDITTASTKASVELFRIDGGNIGYGALLSCDNYNDKSSFRITCGAAATQAGWGAWYGGSGNNVYLSAANNTRYTVALSSAGLYVNGNRANFNPPTKTTSTGHLLLNNGCNCKFYSVKVNDGASSTTPIRDWRPLTDDKIFDILSGDVVENTSTRETKIVATFELE